MKIWGWVFALAVLPAVSFADGAPCTPQSATVTGFPNPTLGIFKADGTFTEQEIPTRDLNVAAIKVCDWNRERNLVRLIFGDRDIWVDVVDLKLRLGDKQPDDRLACADAPSKPTGTQSLASVGVGGAECRKK